MKRLTGSVTYLIAAVTALAWVIATAAAFNAPYILGFIPARWSGMVTVAGAVPTFLTPVTATLAHAGPFHLGFNLLVFVWCGREVERVLGKTSLIVLYLVGAYASALLQWAVDPAATDPMVGASGAISAVIGAYALSFGRPKRFTQSATLNRWINAIWLMVAWVVLQWMMGWLASGQGFLVATPAHVGGFAAGLLLQRPLLLWRYRNA